MTRATRSLLAGAILLLVSTPGLAQWGAPGYDPFNPVIAGIPVHCTSFTGEPVALVPNWNLPDVGRSSPGMPPRIELNPGVLAMMTPKMQLFWYGHECAHHVLGPANSETNADCWSIRTMRDQGLLSPDEVPQLQAQIASTPGTMWGHLPGPQRAALFAQCYQSP